MHPRMFSRVDFPLLAAHDRPVVALREREAEGVQRLDDLAAHAVLPGDRDRHGLALDGRGGQSAAVEVPQARSLRVALGLLRRLGRPPAGRAPGLPPLPPRPWFGTFRQADRSPWDARSPGARPLTGRPAPEGGRPSGRTLGDRPRADHGSKSAGGAGPRCPSVSPSRTVTHLELSRPISTAVRFTSPPSIVKATVSRRP